MSKSTECQTDIFEQGDMLHVTETNTEQETKKPKGPQIRKTGVYLATMDLPAREKTAGHSWTQAFGIKEQSSSKTLENEKPRFKFTLSSPLKKIEQKAFEKRKKTEKISVSKKFKPARILSDSQIQVSSIDNLNDKATSYEKFGVKNAGTNTLDLKYNNISLQPHKRSNDLHFDNKKERKRSFTEEYYKILLDKKQGKQTSFVSSKEIVTRLQAMRNDITDYNTTCTKFSVEQKFKIIPSKDKNQYKTYINEQKERINNNFKSPIKHEIQKNTPEASSEKRPYRDFTKTWSLSTDESEISSEYEESSSSSSTESSDDSNRFSFEQEIKDSISDYYQQNVNERYVPKKQLEAEYNLFPLNPEEVEYLVCEDMKKNLNIAEKPYLDNDSPCNSGRKIQSDQDILDEIHITVNNTTENNNWFQLINIETAIVEEMTPEKELASNEIAIQDTEVKSDDLGNIPEKELKNMTINDNSDDGCDDSREIIERKVICSIELNIAHN